MDVQICFHTLVGRIWPRESSSDPTLAHSYNFVYKLGGRTINQINFCPSRRRAAILFEFSQSLSQAGVSTELIKSKDNVGGWQISSSGSDKPASLSQLIVEATVLESL